MQGIGWSFERGPPLLLFQTIDLIWWRAYFWSCTLLGLWGQRKRYVSICSKSMLRLKNIPRHPSKEAKERELILCSFSPKNAAMPIVIGTTTKYISTGIYPLLIFGHLVNLRSILTFGSTVISRRNLNCKFCGENSKPLVLSYFGRVRE